jgi:hypothetical protein
MRRARPCWGRRNASEFGLSLERHTDEPKRSIIQQELAPEPLSGRPKLDLIRTTPLGIERQVHERSLALEVYNTVTP